MKFVFVNYMMGMYRGGGENFDLNLSEELSRLGHEVEIYYLQPIFKKVGLDFPDYCVPLPTSSPWLYMWSQRMRQIPLVRHLRVIRGLPRAIGESYFELHMIYRLWKRRRENFVVHICGLPFLGMVATMILGARVFVRFPGPPALRIHLLWLRKIHAVIANGDAFRAIQETVPDVNLMRLDIGIDHNLFQKDDRHIGLRESLGLPKAKVLALFVGRFVPVKNMQMLVRVMARVAGSCDNVDLVLVGEGSEFNSIVSMADELGILDRLHFLGVKQGREIIDCYNVADLFLLSSSYDNFPNVVLEAMAMELPVVATRVGGVSLQVMQGETGFLVAENDDESMAERIMFLADNKEERIRLGRAGAAIARENYDWRKTAERFLGCVNDSCDAKYTVD